MSARTVKRYVVLFILIALAAASQTLSMKANIGVCACWDSLALNVYELTGLKIGTFSIAANLCMVTVQLLILRRNFHPIRLMQIPVALLYGSVMNLVYYHVLTFDLAGYPMRMVFCLLSYVGLGIFIGGVTLMDLIPIPTEGTCYVVHKKYGVSFAKIRVVLDGTVIALSVLLSLVFGLSLKIREGTVIGMLLLGPLEQFFMKREEKWFPILREQPEENRRVNTGRQVRA